MEHEHLSIETLAVHGGQSPDPTTGAVMQPVYQTSTYAQDAIGQPRAGYEYARVQNPTREALERNIAALEGCAHGAAFASGLAAIEAIVKRLSAGDHVVSEENVYGGTMRMFQQVLARLGLEFTFVDTRNPDAVRAAIRDETRLIHIETPTNPMMRVTDIRAIADIARSADIPLCVDNTFATPINQRPIELGAQVVVHSATKYLNGHSDVIGGVVATDDEGWAEHLRFMQKATGGILGPWDSWLVLRGTKTLHVRMAAHNRNGMEVARYLAARDDLLGVFYPGLPDDPSHDVARAQMCGFTGMVSFEVEDLDRAQRIARSMRVFTLAESLGGVESLINHPAIMTHASVPGADRARMGLTDGLLRLSVGIEGIGDLLADLERALAA